MLARRSDWRLAGAPGFLALLLVLAVTAMPASAAKQPPFATVVAASTAQCHFTVEYLWRGFRGSQLTASVELYEFKSDGQHVPLGYTATFDGLPGRRGSVEAMFQLTLVEGTTHLIFGRGRLYDDGVLVTNSDVRDVERYSNCF